MEREMEEKRQYESNTYLNGDVTFLRGVRRRKIPDGKVTDYIAMVEINDGNGNGVA